MTPEDFVASERRYFAPIIEGRARVSESQREKWRSETVQERLTRVSLEAYELCGGRVQYGPFKGLQLIRETWWGESDLGAQCFGFYEFEILDRIQKMEDGEFRTFIDIGAADGYYAVGVLKSGKIKKAICFEQSPEGQAAIRNNWKANAEPGSLEVLGTADEISLKRLKPEDLENAFVLIDIEGYEFELLTPDVLRTLKESEVVLEIHEWVDEFCKKYEKFLLDAFEFFEVTVVERLERPASSIPELRSFADDNRLLLMSERRPSLMRFLRLVPK